MDYSIAQIAKLLNTSKVTVYNKISKVKGLKEHVKSTKNGRYVDEIGFELIKKSLIDNPYIETFNRGIEKNEENIIKDTESTWDSNVLIDMIKDLKNELNYLKQTMKDNAEREDISVVLNILKQQLEIKDKQIENLTRLTENSQILLKHEQERSRLQIEASEVKKKRSFWGIFAKK